MPRRTARASATKSTWSTWRWATWRRCTACLPPRRGFTVNLGTGHGYSVLDTVRAFEAASGRAVPYDIVPRRPGDIASRYASADKARELLGWQAQKNIDDMCADHWRWQHQNRQGYLA